ncbi:hypothetical protein WAE61_05355 [Comamonadaceae bacterium PP-2]
MVIFRFVVLLMMVVAAGLFVAYAVTGKPRYRQLGLIVLKWTVIAGLGFFAGLAIERLTA